MYCYLEENIFLFRLHKPVKLEKFSPQKEKRDTNQPVYPFQGK